jgi:hypothetical protein
VRDRIASVKNTMKITEAMKLVAAAKVRRAQEAVVNGRPFTENLIKVSSSRLQQARPAAHSIPPAAAAQHFTRQQQHYSLQAGSKFTRVCNRWQHIDTQNYKGSDSANASSRRTLRLSRSCTCAQAAACFLALLSQPPLHLICV